MEIFINLFIVELHWDNLENVDSGQTGEKGW